MNEEAKKLLAKIDELSEELEEILPGTDPTHRDEVLDICSLLKIRTEMYFKEYGVLS